MNAFLACFLVLMLLWWGPAIIALAVLLFGAAVDLVLLPFNWIANRKD